MDNKVRNVLTIVLPGAVLAGLMLVRIVMPLNEYSDAERRALAGRPELNVESLIDGTFMTRFENYALDQFPLRDLFRKSKAITRYYVLNQRDYNDFYLANGSIVKMNSEINGAKLEASISKHQKLYNECLEGTDCNIYMSVVPDKNYYYGEKNKHLSMDYEAYVDKLCKGMLYAKYIDIFNCLNSDCYYRTDPHWRQEKIAPVANKLCSEMGVAFDDKFDTQELKELFYGAYYYQSSFEVEADNMYYQTSPSIDRARVKIYLDGDYADASVYDMKKALGKDPYEMFLSGAQPLVVIEAADTASKEKEELIIFRDSFGSSIAPLLLESYSRVTLVDLRYMDISAVKKLIKFENQDVLFLYSTLTF